MKLNLKKRSTMIGVIALLCTGVACAQPKDRDRGNEKPPSAKELIKKMDANEDGKLSKDEVEGPLSKDFAKVDLNEDGFITREELEKAPKPERPKRDN